MGRRVSRKTKEEMTTVEVEVGGKKITLETGRLAKQANGAVLVRCGDTMVLVSAVGRTEGREGQDFFPLTVDVEERHYAAGKIPGGFIKRESRPSEKAILAARQIDRPIRPLFTKGYMNEVHVVATVLSVDLENNYDVLATLGASAALGLSEIPFLGPIGSVRVGRIEDEFVINPTLTEVQDESELDLVVTGTKDAIVMVEAGAKQVSEALVVEALRLAHEEIKKLIDVQLELQRQCGKPKWDVPQWTVDEGILAEVRNQYGAALDAATQAVDKKERQDATSEVKKAAVEALLNEDSAAERVTHVKRALAKIEKDLVRDRIAVQKRRPDGRGTDEVRQITCEVCVVSRVHGSALFTRGETQAMSLLTLGGTGEFQRIDGLGIEDKKRYIHHYNFPPYSVGETGFMRGPKRRDIGHGALAERALLPVLPDELDFPYTTRIVSEILESNGSSSMASVCGSTLALMDAGVQITAPVAGTAMGLIKEGDAYVILTDIAGVEDHLGDMDFKVAGTADGITALQMDIKITGVTFAILTEALEQARKARLFILERMLATLAEPRLARLLERLGEDLEGDAGDLDVHLQGGDAVGGAGDLEVHVAEVVFDAGDVGEDDVGVTLLDQAHGGAGHRSGDLHAGVHQRQGRATHAGHRGRAVALEDLRDDARRVGEVQLVRKDRQQGALGEGALLPVLPNELDFPYTTRIVSEILESNGSSSMASVCGSTLALMDAGVQITAPVAGTAMGLIKEGDAYVILTDIAGVEDHLGDMDFKV